MPKKHLSSSELLPVADLYLAAYLHSAGYPLVDIERMRPHRAYFTFRDVPIEEINDWMDGKITCNLAHFIAAIRDLRRQMYTTSAA